ncbi:hypothetical protein GW943_02520 [Candidatus Parcubacteria bacterium]|uniref:Uncharacterized protein n=1 Tax=Candidatus Kaiserbacteria bacterium CG10_big_fil_rev_8_21_14_0_10_47_16 TaxID=1974608 RepID=A0A2H0UDM7_9BACT|nr:hypothetical protein [Candidatus Parcubacteria bacterium]PIR84487.1 MAG: hypothetical protein COU16_02830 [Candidatus Kaiserbacteria bacterium CG10_big_fil_rev_8_21_14_0_10_47_16]
MRHKTLHEIAKFCAGLVAADFIILVWMANAGILPIEFLGRMFTVDILLPGLVFDAALFLILVHYGWNIGKIPALRERTYLFIAGIVFAIVAIAHLFRIFVGADLIIGGWDAPLWLSWLGTAVTTYLAYMSLRLALRMKK